jgi:hypothetical protein
LDENLTATRTFSTYPNPANDVLNLSFRLNEPQHLDIRLVSMMGAEIAVIGTLDAAAGQHDLSFSLSDLNLSEGLYLLSITSDLNGPQTQRILITK